MKKIAMTLAELMIMLIIISIIVVFIITTIQSKATVNLNRFMYYSAFTNLKYAIAELLGTGTMPTTGTDLCNKLSELYNTLGNVECNSAATVIASDDNTFADETPNFKTTNGMNFYNFATNPISNVYTVYIDIDGAYKRNARLNNDVMKFTISTSGVVLPDIDSNGANNPEFLATSVRYVDNTASTVWLKHNVSYKESVCTAAEVTSPTYCAGYPANAICTSGSYICEVVIHKPGYYLFGL